MCKPQAPLRGAHNRAVIPIRDGSRLGRGLPEGVQVRAVEESADTIYLVLPSASAPGGQGGSLSDQELEAAGPRRGRFWGFSDSLRREIPELRRSKLRTSRAIPRMKRYALYDELGL